MGDHEPGSNPGPRPPRTSAADEPVAQPNRRTSEPRFNATLGSRS